MKTIDMIAAAVRNYKDGVLDEKVALVVITMLVNTTVIDDNDKQWAEEVFRDFSQRLVESNK